MFSAIVLIALATVIVAVIWYRYNSNDALPPAIRIGQTLPSLKLVDENNENVSFQMLQGRPAVVVFLRGSWCPFCNAQVEKLTRSYRRINELGANLIFVTPKPLATTRRVADHFNVEFDFWLDKDLAMAAALGIRASGEVPDEIRERFGSDTVWPTSLLVDGEGSIRYSSMTHDIRARPDPDQIIKALELLRA